MEVKVRIIEKDKIERVDINCHEITEDVKEIVTFVKQRQGQITGTLEGEQYEILLTNIYYIESVDDVVFIYCKNQVYETRKKLYEIEEQIGYKQFFRVSKSCIVNLMKVKSIKPALNGRYLAQLISGEGVIISRKYVPDLKKKLKGESK